MAQRHLLEVCVDTPAGLQAAIAGGADRIELCSALDLGGLTPAPGLITLAAQQPVSVRAMVRPHAKSFRYDADDRNAMLADIDAIRKAGLTGVVLGATTKEGGLDVPLLRLLVRAAAGLEITLHRCVDLLADPVEAVDLALSLGVGTILTSGGALTAEGGMSTIGKMQRAAAGRVEILAGSGINSENVADILTRTGVRSVHASGRAALPLPDPREVALGFSAARARDTNQREVALLRRALDQHES
jgi:copper homeostasis protein